MTPMESKQYFNKKLVTSIYSYFICYIILEENLNQ